MNKKIKAGADIHAGDGGYSEGTQEQYDAFVKVRNKSLAQGRIKELAEKAGIYKLDLSDETEYWIIEKFAELIVKECVEQSMSIGRYNTPSGITPDLSIAIAVGLKKHFGVEE